MKKILFAAVLFAGTTLGFAKDNVKKTEVEVTKTEVVAKNQHAKVDDENLDLAKRLRICFENYYWTTIESYYDIYTDTVQHQYVHHIAQYSYLCGDSGPRSTTINGNPADYGL